MKNLLCSFGMALLVMAFGTARAQQTWTHVYKEVQTGYTIDGLPGTGEYIAGGTFYDPSGKNRIHLLHYDNAGNLIPSMPFVIDEPSFDERCVKVIGINNTEFLVVTFAQKIGSSTAFVRVIHMDVFGGLYADQKFMSTDPTFFSLFPTDAIYDPAYGQIVVVGTAGKSSQALPGDNKQAFALRIDLGLNFLAMNFYDSFTGGGANDYDIATRIIKTAAGQYYVTGSENVIKFGSVYSCGLRNMLIDPFSLNPIWSNPMALQIDLLECSVDMTEVNGYFATLVNLGQYYWGVLRIDPSSGNAFTGNMEMESNLGTGFCFLPQTNPGSAEIIVAGMKWADNGGGCGSYDPNQADPFVTALDMNPYPCNQIQKTEYLSAIGNYGASTGLRYWDLGGFYAVQNAYTYPWYLNKFAARLNNSPGNDMGLIAPIIEASSLMFMNTKFIQTDPFGNNNCPMQTCVPGFSQLLPTMPPFNFETVISLPAAPVGTTWSIVKDFPIAQYDCSSGYYKTANLTAGNATLPDAAGIKVYPNPAATIINIDLNGYDGKTLSIELYNVMGEHVATIFKGDATATVSYTLPQNLAKGLYTLAVEAQGMDKRIEKISIQ